MAINITKYTSHNLLFILNSDQSIKLATAVLKGYSHNLKITHNLVEAVTALPSFDADILFISWNLKKTNVKKFYEIMTKKFGYLCVVMAESNSPLVVNDLMKSRIPNMLLPPVTGDSIHKRTLELLMKKKTFFETFRRISISALPAQGNWGKLEGSKSGSGTWQLSDNENIEQKYYGRGDYKPKFDKEKGLWGRFRDEFAFERIVPLTARQKAGKDEIEDPYQLAEYLPSSAEVQKGLGLDALINDLELKSVPAETTITGKARATTAKIAKSVQSAVDTSVIRTSQETQSIKKVSKATLTLVKTDNFKGYILGVNASDSQDEDLMGKVRSNLKGSLGKESPDQQSHVTVHKMQLDEVAFKVWADRNAEFVINSQHGEDDVAFACFASSTIMEQAGKDSGVFNVDLEKFLIPDTDLTFDVYIHFPENKKFIQYLRKGSRASAITKEKLLKMGIKNFSIKNEEKEFFNSYCINHEINVSIREFKKKGEK